MQLPVADVDRDDARSAALQQNVGEAAGRGADVGRVETGRIDAECVEAVRKLVAAARDVGLPGIDRELGVLVDLLARLLVAGNPPRHDEGLRLGP
jgi:hypothetical protein